MITRLHPAPQQCVTSVIEAISNPCEKGPWILNLTVVIFVAISITLTIQSCEPILMPWARNKSGCIILNLHPLLRKARSVSSMDMAKVPMTTLL